MARNTIQRLGAHVRTFFGLDAAELVELQSQFDAALDDVDRPRGTDAKRNALLIDGRSETRDEETGKVLKKAVEPLDLDAIRLFPLYPLVEEIFELISDEDFFPDFASIRKAAKKDLDRVARGKKPKGHAWEDEVYADDVDEVFRACKSALRKEKRSPMGALGLWSKARLLHESKNVEAKGVVYAKAMAAYNFADEWLDERLDSIEAIERHNAALEMIANEETLATVNRGLRAGNPKALGMHELMKLRKAAAPFLELLASAEVQMQIQDGIQDGLRRNGKKSSLRFTEPSEA